MLTPDIEGQHCRLYQTRPEHLDGVLCEGCADRSLCALVRHRRLSIPPPLGETRRMSHAGRPGNLAPLSSWSVVASDGVRAERLRR